MAWDTINTATCCFFKKATVMHLTGPQSVKVSVNRNLTLVVWYKKKQTVKLFLSLTSSLSHLTMRTKLQLHFLTTTMPFLYSTISIQIRPIFYFTGSSTNNQRLEKCLKCPLVKMLTIGLQLFHVKTAPPFPIVLLTFLPNLCYIAVKGCCLVNLLLALKREATRENVFFFIAK